MRNLIKSIKCKLIKWLGGYTELDEVLVKHSYQSNNFVIIESSQLFPYRRFIESDTFKGYAKEVTIKSLIPEIQAYIETHDCIEVENVPDVDCVRMRIRLKLGE